MTKYTFTDHPMYDKAPAIRALSGRPDPGSEHLRACIMELCRIVQPLWAKEHPQPPPSFEDLEKWFQSFKARTVPGEGKPNQKTVPPDNSRSVMLESWDRQHAEAWIDADGDLGFLDRHGYSIILSSQAISVLRDWLLANPTTTHTGDEG
jgi:hypothetical protein